MADDFNYKRYLASREWGLLKQAVRRRARGECERCPTSNPIAAVHHLTYERIGHEDLDDLQAVCHGCHAFLGGHSDVDPVVVAVEEQIAAASRSACADWLAAELRIWEETTPRPRSWMAFQWERQNGSLAASA